ncbi:MAG TPA: non-homologous end-joining DNA ligase [Pyrinomonadaceae bacterium]|nr:non-homologous end-joining DNA ligase [Pyrinomonadaceae bacterium]
MTKLKMGLEVYHRKRDFARTPEPRGRVAKVNRRRFVVQEHHASMLHFDFRLEIGGVLKSWSVRRGPSLDPAERRLAVETEDHPVEYLKFQGDIPEGNYGAGQHRIWDAGTYKLVEGTDAVAQYEAGKMKFSLDGRKLKGVFNLVRLGRGRGQWLLIKSRDEFAEEGWELETLLPVEGKSRGKARTRERAARRESADKKGVRRTAAKKSAKPVAAARLFKEKKLAGDVDVRVGREVVSLTNLDRVYWPEDGLTKGDLVRYYHEVAKYILPYLKDRPLIMKRYPSGIRGQSFHQHDVNEAPDYVRTVALEVEDATGRGTHEVDYVVGDDEATLLYMANLGAIERHPWHSRVRNLERPDWFVFDLDPGEGVRFETICELALAVRDVLARLRLEGYPKTSGSRGLHVYVPVRPQYDYDVIAQLAERVATVVAEENPEIATVERSLKKRRRGQIYVDHMQNARGKSVVAPYSVRPREGASVSAPLEWSEVERARITPRDFTIKNMLRRIGKKGDLFGPVLGRRQSLAEALRRAEELAAVAPRARRAKA